PHGHPGRQEKHDVEGDPPVPHPQMNPAGKTSWAAISADIKKQIGTAVTSTGNPTTVLTRLQAEASLADSRTSTG
ncbi:hypothetical protein ABZ372_23195, partial [Streptomyces sp. NPDC005921]